MGKMDFSESCALFFLLLTITVTGIQTAKNVTIQKCCALKETLDKNRTCVPSTKNEWDLKIYSPAKKNFLPKHTIPTNWHFKYSSMPDCPEPFVTGEDFGYYVGFLNGSLLAVRYGTLLHPNDYCIDYNSAKLCLAEKRSEIKKCCGHNSTFSTERQGCVLGAHPSLKLDDVKGEKLSAGYPTCNSSNEIAIVRTFFNESNFHTNGSLWLPEHRILLPPSRYCLEHVLEHTDETPAIIGCREDFFHEKPDDVRFVFYPIGLALSTVFLAATLACGFLLPASHHVLHWRCQTNYVFCLLIGFAVLCLVQLQSTTHPTLCTIFAVTIHFFILSAFFWLNTMCFNIWWTFRDLRPQSIEKSQERCRLRLYKLYAWGIPFVIAGIGVILDSLPDNDLIKPRFGENKCWFGSEREKLPFFNGPIGLLLTINLVLFILTAKELTCGLWKRELVKSTTERAALGRVCMKLVIVMGVTWITDVLSDAVGGPQEIWYLFDVFNSLQGVFIFIVIGCQPQVLSAVKRLWCFRDHHENGTAGTSNHHSSTFQGIQSTGDTMTNSITNTTKSTPVETIC
ncbi:probable G-protein coupled receptor Mth-like 1 [Coccinella septempunctata]|uniref:probable G-protein coupled receptor Mth-like 1 n=1 Tax=Coccinella septempunctata TaxID=41139 RepID=UPI001D067DBF|nr:probable G-protein coupled receptor Mth-like 1 [Coccinella septempunctata]